MRDPKIYSIITYLLTPWSRVLLDKLTGSVASQEIPRIFGTRRFLIIIIIIIIIIIFGAGVAQMV